MVLIACMGFEKAIEMMGTGESSPNLTLPTYPFVFFLVFGCFIMCIEFIKDIIRIFKSKKEYTDK